MEGEKERGFERGEVGRWAARTARPARLVIPEEREWAWAPRPPAPGMRTGEEAKGRGGGWGGAGVEVGRWGGGVVPAHWRKPPPPPTERLGLYPWSHWSCVAGARTARTPAAAAAFRGPGSKQVRKDSTAYVLSLLSSLSSLSFRYPLHPLTGAATS